MTDQEIIQKCKEGDAQAFDALVTQYQSKVINMCYGMLSHQDDAYDAAQEVFLRVYKHIGSFREMSSLSTWIYKITVNTCNDMLRKRRRTVTVSLSLEDDENSNGMPEIADNTPLPEEQIQRRETVAAVREAIAQLKDEYRQMILLCDIEGQSYEEAAQISGCPVGTVKSRLNRARKALRKILSEKRELFL